MEQVLKYVLSGWIGIALFYLAGEQLGELLYRVQSEIPYLGTACLFIAIFGAASVWAAFCRTRFAEDLRQCEEI